MSKNELLMRERLSATGARVSKSETTQTTRVLRDDELDAVSGGLQNAERVSSNASMSPMPDNDLNFIIDFAHTD